jgi:hypothetical protein
MPFPHVAAEIAGWAPASMATATTASTSDVMPFMAVPPGYV